MMARLSDDDERRLGEEGLVEAQKMAEELGMKPPRSAVWFEAPWELDRGLDDKMRESDADDESEPPRVNDVILGGERDETDDAVDEEGLPSNGVARGVWDEGDGDADEGDGGAELVISNNADTARLRGEFRRVLDEADALAEADHENGQPAAPSPGPSPSPAPPKPKVSAHLDVPGRGKIHKQTLFTQANMAFKKGVKLSADRLLRVTQVANQAESLREDNDDEPMVGLQKDVAVAFGSGREKKW